MIWCDKRFSKNKIDLRGILLTTAQVNAQVIPKNDKEIKKNTFRFSRRVFFRRPIYTNSRRTIGAASPRRGPSFRMRV